jgi:hypothetical protein
MVIADADPTPPDLVCPASPSTIEFSLQDRIGKPVPNARVTFVVAGTITPDGVLSSHLRTFGLPTTTDGSGRIVIANLSPGDYTLFYRAPSVTIATGSGTGYLGAVTVSPREDVQVTLTTSAAP